MLSGNCVSGPKHAVFLQSNLCQRDGSSLAQSAAFMGKHPEDRLVCPPALFLALFIKVVFCFFFLIKRMLS